MPPVLQDAIARVSELPEGDVRRTFFIGAAEHMVAAFGLMQWGHEWRSEKLFEVHYNTDSQNSFNWIKSMFSGNELVQDLCRVIQALCMVNNVVLRGLWWPTTAIWMEDTVSRMLDADGSVIQKVFDEFMEINSKLQRPYKRVKPVPNIFWLRKVFASSRDGLSTLSPAHLYAEQLLNAGLQRGMSSEVQVGSTMLSVSMRQHLLETRNAFSTNDMKAFFRSKAPAWSFCSVGSAACVDLHGIAKTRAFIPLFGFEVIPARMQMWRDATDTVNLGNVFHANAASLPWVSVWVITMPCENYARSGNWLGSHGKTGWMWTAVFDWVIACKPKAFLSEQSDNAINVNHGADLALIREKVADLYVVHVFVVPLAQYGVPSHRARLFLVGLLRTDAGAAEFVPPGAEYGEHNRFCLDDVLEADSLVPPDKWFNTKLRTMYKYVIPPFGEIQKIGRLAPGMGLSHNPHACAGRKGVSWAPTGYGGGGTVVQEGYVPNTEVKWRRKFTLREHHAIATAPQSMLPWHQQFVKSEADLIQCVNQGIPVQAMFCWMSALQQHFESSAFKRT